ncbi:MAG: IS630 family transposase [Chlamydiota bacterium]
MKRIKHKEKKRFEVRIKIAKDISERNRLCVLLAWGKGRDVKEIADILHLSEDAVYRYIREYKNTGKDSDHPRGGSATKLDSDQEKELIDHLNEITYLNVKDICHYVEKKYEFTYSKSGMKDWLKRQGFVYKKPKKIPGKLDPKKQKEFIKFYKELKKNLKPEEEVYFVDAVHPQHQSEALCGWIKKGEDKTLQTTGKQLRLHFAGAICLKGMKTFVKEYKSVDAEAMINFFDELEKSSTASKIYVIMDNARSNKNKKLAQFLETSKIEPIYLPPYSPNLNAIERLWKILREKKIHNRYYESCVDFFRQIRKFFQGELTEMAEQLKRRINDNFQAIEINPITCAFAD